MKKFMCGLLVMTSILLTSCSGREDVKVDNETKEVTSTDGIICKESPYFMKTFGIATSEEGYYTQNYSFEVDVDTNQINEEGDYIAFISKKTGKEIYLCSKLECSHFNEKGKILSSCNANVKCVLPASINYNDGWVYILTYNKNSYDVTLTRLSEDGSVHEDIMVVGQAPSMSGYYEYVFVNNDIYIVDNIEETGNIYLDKIDINKKEKNTVFSSEKEGSLGSLKVVKDNIFGIQNEKRGESRKKSIIKYNNTTGEMDSLVANDLIISYTIVDENTLYYYVETEGLYRLDINTNKSKLVRACDEETKSVHLAYDGTYLYMENEIKGYRYNENSIHQIFVCDLDGNIINSIGMEEYENILPAAFCDEFYLFATHYSHEGQQWTYIKHEDITKKDVTWTNIE